MDFLSSTFYFYLKKVKEKGIIENSGEESGSSSTADEAHGRGVSKYPT